jgi:DNA-binding transcriptional MerR regulator
MFQNTQYYSVHQVADMAGVSVRTLHHYDQIGLLSPARAEDNLYRRYGRAEIERLQLILFYRELEFPLDQIQRMLTSPDFDQQQAYRDHYRLLQLKKERLERLLKTLEQQLSKGHVMQDAHLLDAFSDETMRAYQKEAQERWGHTDAYRQSAERTNHWSKADFQRIKDEGETFTKSLVEVMPYGPTSAEAQAKIIEHRQSVNVFYDCTDEIYAGLAEMYVADPRFAKYYNRFHPDLAQFMHDAMLYSLQKESH